MPGPRKTDYTHKILEYTQINAQFLKKLWGPEGDALRTKLIDTTDQDQLRGLLAENGIPVDPGVRILIVDILNAKANGFNAGAASVDFYALVLPPSPRRSPAEPDAKKLYDEMQTWFTAHYHAVNDSYGM
jgi:hypothetical protein